MKIALCFIISYEQILNKEALWREWIDENKDIINVYFHYRELATIQSQWICSHAIPKKYIVKTLYYHVVPAYMNLLRYAKMIDAQNQWFCLLTDSCVPIISPLKFRQLFFENYHSSIMKWSRSWWNINLHKRANLRLLDSSHHLANDPWFILCKTDLNSILRFTTEDLHLFNTVCRGGLANESIFAIILFIKDRFRHVINTPSHVTDWVRMSSATSPHLFIKGDDKDVAFIDDFLKKNTRTVFLRKVHRHFPDDLLSSIVYDDGDDLNKSARILYVKKLEWIHFSKTYLIYGLIYMFIPFSVIFLTLYFTGLDIHANIHTRLDI